MKERLALVTGATGFIGSHLVPALLSKGWRVRVLTRHPEDLPEQWRCDVEAVRGDAESTEDVRCALAGVDCAYYLIHSMDGHGDYQERDRRMSQVFADAAKRVGVGRIVYLSGLHPEGVELSDHMRSRVEVGNTLLDSGVPTLVLQAAVVLGSGSASFQMLRHLTERLPVMVAPKWIDNRVQPVALADVVFYLARAAEVAFHTSRSVDVAMDEVLTYRDMMQRYASVTGLRRRLIAAVPVLTPKLAARWVGLVTPVSAGIAKPLVGSLIQDSVKHDDDANELFGEPPGGLTGFDDAIRSSTHDVDPRLWGRTAIPVACLVLATAALTFVKAVNRRR